MSVGENFGLEIGYPSNAVGRVSWRRLHASTEAVLRRFGLAIGSRTRLGRLGAADRALVAIARALHDAQDGRRVLVLDEPTASLPEREAERLLTGLRRAADDGQAILLVEPQAAGGAGGRRPRHRPSRRPRCRRATLRDGRADADPADRRRRTRAGRHRKARRAVRGKERLRVEALACGGLRDVSLSCAAGEIVGILGLLGSGRSRLLRAIAGDAVVAGGAIEIDGTRLRAGSTVAAASYGVAFVAEARSQTVFRDWLVRYNATISTIDRYWRRGFLRRREEATAVAAAIRRYGVRTASDTVPVSQLSGGNQQKLVLARTLAAEPKVVLLDEPSVGVDVVARAQIHSILRQAAAGGAAILVVSSDTTELAQLCDRVLVLAGGRVTGELAGSEVETTRLVDALHSSRTEPGR